MQQFAIMKFASRFYAELIKEFYKRNDEVTVYLNIKNPKEYYMLIVILINITINTKKTIMIKIIKMGEN